MALVALGGLLTYQSTVHTNHAFIYVGMPNGLDEIVLLPPFIHKMCSGLIFQTFFRL